MGCLHAGGSLVFALVWLWWYSRRWILDIYEGVQRVINVPQTLTPFAFFHFLSVGSSMRLGKTKSYYWNFLPFDLSLCACILRNETAGCCCFVCNRFNSKENKMQNYCVYQWPQSWMTHMIDDTKTTQKNARTYPICVTP